MINPENFEETDNDLMPDIWLWTTITIGLLTLGWVVYVALS